MYRRFLSCSDVGYTILLIKHQLLFARDDKILKTLN